MVCLDLSDALLSQSLTKARRTEPIGLMRALESPCVFSMATLAKAWSNILHPVLAMSALAKRKKRSLGFQSGDHVDPRSLWYETRTMQWVGPILLGVNRRFQHVYR